MFTIHASASSVTHLRQSRRQNRGPLKAVVSTCSLPGLQQGGWLTRHRHSGMFLAGIQPKSCVVSDS